MAVILVGIDDSNVADILSKTIAALGHTPLPLFSTENIVEDVVLNDVRLALFSAGLRPYSGWDCCEMLRSDPAVPDALPVLMLADGSLDQRRLERCGFSGTLNPADCAAVLSEVIVRDLGDCAAPEVTPSLAELDLDGPAA